MDFTLKSNNPNLKGGENNYPELRASILDFLIRAFAPLRAEGPNSL